MKKYMNIYTILLIILFAGSCVKDDSNTELVKLNTVAISGIADKLTTYMDTALSIKPTISTSLNDETNLSFIWYIYGSSQQGPADTLAKVKNLSVIIPNPGTYTLVFKVIDKPTGVFYKYESALTVMNDLTTGLMILAETNGKAKLHFLNTANGKYFSDVYLKRNNEELGSKPVSITVQNMASTNQEIVILCKDNRGGVFTDITSFTKMRELKASFYTSPFDGNSEINVQAYCKATGLQDYLIIDGKVYNRAVNMKDYYFKPALLGDYYVSDYYNTSSYPAFYDNKNMRFMAHNNTQGTLNLFLQPTDISIINPAKVDLVQLFGKLTAAPRSLGLFKNPNGNERYILTMTLGPSGLLFVPISKYQITSENIENASAYATSVDVADYLFYASGGKVYVHNTLTKIGALLFDLGPSYKINCLKTEKTELRIGFTNSSSTGMKGGFARFNVTTIGGIKATEIMRKEGICDQVVDLSQK